MTATTLALDGMLALATAVLYGWVGLLMLRRPTSDADGRLALSLFAVWWFGLAIVTALSGARLVLGAMGVLDLPLHYALSIVGVVPLVAALWGLVYYLMFVYLGRRSLLWPITILHALLLGGFLYLTVWLEPTAIQVTDWNVALQYERQITGPLLGLVLFGILGPALLATLGYGSLLFQARDRTARYRIAMVSGGFLLWFGSSAISVPLGLNEWYWWPLASRIIGLVATALILAAYRPPRWLARALGVHGVTDGEAPPAARDAPLMPRGLPALLRRAPTPT